MSIDWNQFLQGFQVGQSIGSQLGARSEIRDIQNQQVTQTPGAFQQDMQTGQTVPVPQAGATFNPSIGMTAQPRTEGVQNLPSFQFMGEDYGQTAPTQLQQDVARQRARADVFDKFGMFDRAQSARDQASRMGAQDQQSRLAEMQLQQQQISLEREQRAQQADQQAALAWGGNPEALAEVFKTVGGGRDAEGNRMGVEMNKDGSISITGTDAQGNPTSQQYKDMNSVPASTKAAMTSAWLQQQYLAVGGDYTQQALSNQFRDLSYGLQQKAQQESVRQFEAKMDQDMEQYIDKRLVDDAAREESRRRWEAEYGLKQLQLDENKRMNNQLFEKRKMEILKAKNQTQKEWEKRNEILSDAGNPKYTTLQVAWALGLEVWDQDTFDDLDQFRGTIADQKTAEAAMTAEPPPLSGQQQPGQQPPMADMISQTPPAMNQQAAVDSGEQPPMNIGPAQLAILNRQRILQGKPPYQITDLTQPRQ